MVLNRKKVVEVQVALDHKVDIRHCLHNYHNYPVADYHKVDNIQTTWVADHKKILLEVDHNCYYSVFAMVQVLQWVVVLVVVHPNYYDYYVAMEVQLRLEQVVVAKVQVLVHYYLRGTNVIF